MLVLTTGRDGEGTSMTGVTEQGWHTEEGKGRNGGARFLKGRRV